MTNFEIMNENNINLILERGKVWELNELPPNSIALDGAVRGPAMDPVNRTYSFDHHEGCVRHSTSATCVQVMDAILLGLDPTGMNVYINDVDGDTVASLVLLMVRGGHILNRGLIEAVGKVDAHGPAYPVSEEVRPLVDNFYNGVLEPLNRRKRDKSYGTCDLFLLLEEILGNIINPPPLQEEVETRSYEVTQSEKGYIIAQSDSFIFDLLYREGHTKCIAYSVQKDGSYGYTIGKKSEFVDFPVRKILERLKEIEPGWGGGSTIGGAPRNSDGSRSRIPPEELMKIIDSILP